ncbi:uncharacterized protein [Arachis hypogaea]|uniref:uncharacterized protein n=1 Tax=Arachis hypogaea TaxID=3818 RepID=UPI000DEC577A|nr:uncharacterized protein LOC112803773 [Arachis hypogaea]
MGSTPFHHSILEVQLPKHFDKPTDMRYDGTQDPQEHLTAFEARMNLEGVGDQPCLLGQFTTRIAKAKHPINLLDVTQRAGETTRKYLDQFNDECLEIEGLTDSVANLCLTNGLLNEDFRKHLTTKPVWTMHEIQIVAKEYINDEEVSQVVAANKRLPANSRKGDLVVAPTSKRPYRGNKSLYCDYHKGYGHQTQDCFDLKDALEQAISDEKLTEFSHLIRELRRRHRDYGDEGKTRSTKWRQEPEDNDHDLTVINVVTAKNTTPKSRSAHKKDAKVLAVSSSSARSSKRSPTISFGPEDHWFDEAPENPPMVITARVGTGLVKRILVDTGQTRTLCSATCSMPWDYETLI